MLMLVLANHDPEKSKLRSALASLPPSPHAEVRIATATLMGYGLYDPGVLDLPTALSRFAGSI